MSTVIKTIVENGVNIATRTVSQAVTVSASETLDKTLTRLELSSSAMVVSANINNLTTESTEEEILEVFGDASKLLLIKQASTAGVPVLVQKEEDGDFVIIPTLGTSTSGDHVGITWLVGESTYKTISLNIDDECTALAVKSIETFNTFDEMLAGVEIGVINYAHAWSQSSTYSDSVVTLVSRGSSDTALTLAPGESCTLRVTQSSTNPSKALIGAHLESDSEIKYYVISEEISGGTATITHTNTSTENQLCGAYVVNASHTSEDQDYTGPGEYYLPEVVFTKGTKVACETLPPVEILGKLAVTEQTASSVVLKVGTRNNWADALSSLALSVPTLGAHEMIELCFTTGSTFSGITGVSSSYKWSGYTASAIPASSYVRILIEQNLITVAKYE